MKKQGSIYKVFGYTFFIGRSKKFDADLEKVTAILAKDHITMSDRFTLLNIYKSAYHESGKIEGITSFDCSATNCSYCKAMRKKAEKCPAHICNMCYDFAQEQWKIESLNRHSLNMLVMSKVDFTIDELSIIPAGMLNRINSSGDIPNITLAKNMVKIALAHPLCKFAFWTKNVHALTAATEKLSKPENAIYIRSSEIIGRPAELTKYFDYVFTVYPDQKTVLAAIAAGSAECNGKKCKECGYKCYYGTHKNVNIAELLRGVDAKKRAFIIEWLENN